MPIDTPLTKTCVKAVVVEELESEVEVEVVPESVELVEDVEVESLEVLVEEDELLDEPEELVGGAVVDGALVVVETDPLDVVEPEPPDVVVEGGVVPDGAPELVVVDVVVLWAWL